MRIIVVSLYNTFATEPQDGVIRRDLFNADKFLISDGGTGVLQILSGSTAEIVAMYGAGAWRCAHVVDSENLPVPRQPKELILGEDKPTAVT